MSAHRPGLCYNDSCKMRLHPVCPVCICSRGVINPAVLARFYEFPPFCFSEGCPVKTLRDRLPGWARQPAIFVKWLIFACLIGLICGGVGTLFHFAIDAAAELRG